MARKRGITTKRALEAINPETSARKRARSDKGLSGQPPPQDILAEVDISADLLNTTFWSTVTAFIKSGSDVEAQTLRWQHILKNVYLIGTAQRRVEGAVDGQISSSTLKLLHTAAEAAPYQKEHRPRALRKSRGTTTSDDTDDEDQDDHELDEESTTTPSKSGRSQAPATPPAIRPDQAPEPSKRRPGTLSPRERASTWHSAWALVIQPFDSTTWASGLTDILTHIFSYDSVNDIVRFLDDLYRTKDVVSINNGTKAMQSLRSTNDQAREVALKFKALWSATESAALSQCAELFAYHELGLSLCTLEAELDQIDQLPAKDLGEFARKYLEGRGHGSRRRETENTRATFIAQHLLEVLGYSKSSGRSDAEVKEKKRLLKAQRMTAKNMKAFVDVFREGCLLLMWKSVWPSVLDQVSDKKVRPLLEKLALDKPELCKVARPLGRVMAYAKNKHTIAHIPRIVIRAQELEVEHRGSFSMMELLGPPESEVLAASIFE